MAIRTMVKGSATGVMRTTVWTTVQAAARAAAQQIGRTLGWTLQRLQDGTGRTDKRRQLHLVESLALGNRRQLLLVGYGSQRYLVGAGADSVGTPLAVDAGSEPNAHSEPLRRSASRSNAVVNPGPHLVKRAGRPAPAKPVPGAGLWQ